MDPSLCPLYPFGVVIVFRDGDMQLHVHSQIAHVAKTSTDGKWRAPDSLGYNEHVGAVAAIVSQHLEEALTARFGLEWTARDDGHGFEIKGISGEMMCVFSSRRASITADLRVRAARFKERYGRAPSQRELAQLAQASNFKTRAAKDGALDFAQLHAGWADKLARTLGVSLGVDRTIGLARRRPRRCARARPGRTSPGSGRTRAGPRGAESDRARAAGQEHLDPRGRDQVPGPRPAPLQLGSRPPPPCCSRTWPTARCGRSSSRLPAWKHPRWSRCRAACCAPTGAVSTSGTAACGTPPARSWPWKNASSRKRARAARRTWRAPRPLTRSARTPRGSRTR